MNTIEWRLTPQRLWVDRPLSSRLCPVSTGTNWCVRSLASCHHCNCRTLIPAACLQHTSCDLCLTSNLTASCGWCNTLQRWDETHFDDMKPWSFSHFAFEFQVFGRHRPTQARVAGLQLPWRGQTYTTQQLSSLLLTLESLFWVFSGQRHLWGLQHGSTWSIDELLQPLVSRSDSSFSRRTACHQGWVSADGSRQWTHLSPSGVKVRTSRGFSI